MVDRQGLSPALTTPPASADRPVDQAVVLVLRLPEAALSRPAGPSTPPGTPLGHQIACAAQEIAATYAIPYMKMMGATIVAAAGPMFDVSNGTAAPGDAATRMAEAAIALRERCAALFDDEDGQSAFRLGLDAGLVQGGLVGQAPGLFNIWGEALDGAACIADSAPDGAIQTSEAAYALLRQHYLFRPRGLFHRPGVGDTHSYVLGGRA